jgi:hypothetical protein
VLNGRIRGFLPNNGSPSRSGLKRTQSNVNNGGNAGTTPAPPTNNAAKRRANLNAYINNLQRQLSNRGKLNKLNKPRYLSELTQNNSTGVLDTIKAKVKANAQRILRSSPQGNVNMSNANNENRRGVKRRRT